jgi:hypothetical protein
MQLGFGLRVGALYSAPPGWRDDELINIYALAGELFEGKFPLYFTGASGHEPLYHYLQAGFSAVFDHNVLSAHLLSAFLGTLTIPLTFVLVRRWFGSLMAYLSVLGLIFSFWSLMYSRIALRHINLPPVVLAVLILLWTPLVMRRFSTRRWAIPLGLFLSLGLYIYPAARLLPILVVVFGLYLALFHRERFKDAWRGYLLALVITAILALPLIIAINRGSSDAAAQGIGADARLVELARPVYALREGDPRPLLENIWKTLGMFHATGDPEWLYNIADRPVFNLLGGVLFWGGVLLCLRYWRRPRYFILLLWLGFGLLPTFASVPAASLSHSIMIQPLVYLFPVVLLVQLYHWATKLPARPGIAAWASIGLRGAVVIVTVSFLLSNVVRDFNDYFSVWPKQEMVRFLYRADYRQVARYLEEHPEITEAALGSTILGTWDRLALMDDLVRDDVRVRFFNPEWSLLLPAQAFLNAQPSAIFVTAFPTLDQDLAGLLDHPPIWQKMGLQRYDPPAALPAPQFSAPSLALFENGLELVGATWMGGEPVPGKKATLWLTWDVERVLDLPPIPIVANPPPAGIYNGPRLAVFAHLLAADGAFLAGDDALWVDPSTLRSGDRFVQIHRFILPAETTGEPHMLEVGLYDPLDGQRVLLQGDQAGSATDYLLLPLDKAGRGAKLHNSRFDQQVSALTR